MKRHDFKVTNLDKFLTVASPDSLYNMLLMKYGRQHADRIANESYGFIKHEGSQDELNK